MTKLYICGPEDNGEGVYHLVAESGEHLASHFCSNSGYARADLHDQRPERKKLFTEKFGEYKVLWIGEDETSLEELSNRNEKLGGLNKSELPSVTMTVVDDDGNKKEIQRYMS